MGESEITPFTLSLEPSAAAAAVGSHLEAHCSGGRAVPENGGQAPPSGVAKQLLLKQGAPRGDLWAVVAYNG